MNDRPLDLDAVARDDELLDLLASGLRPDTPDPVIRALYTWRNDLTVGVGAPPALPSEVMRPPRVTGVAQVSGSLVNGGKINGHRTNGSPVNRVPRVNGAAPPAEGESGMATEEEATGEVRRVGRRRAAVAAVVVGMSAGLGGVAVAAADAEPGSPLWPITRVIYADSAEDRQHEVDAKSALTKAREALADGRVSEAERYLDEAGRHAAATDSPSAQELRDEVAAVRRQLREQETDGTGTPAGDPSPSDDPTNSGDDPTDSGDDPTDSGDGQAPVPTPALPTPSSAVGDGADSDKQRDNGRDGRAPDDTRKGRPEATSGRLSPETTSGRLSPETTSGELRLPGTETLDIPRSLPES